MREALAAKNGKKRLAIFSTHVVSAHWFSLGCGGLQRAASKRTISKLVWVQANLHKTKTRPVKKPWVLVE